MPEPQRPGRYVPTSAASASRPALAPAPADAVPAINAPGRSRRSAPGGSHGTPPGRSVAGSAVPVELVAEHRGLVRSAARQDRRLDVEPHARRPVLDAPMRRTDRQVERRPLTRPVEPAAPIAHGPTPAPAPPTRHGLTAGAPLPPHASTAASTARSRGRIRSMPPANAELSQASPYPSQTVASDGRTWRVSQAARLAR